MNSHHQGENSNLFMSHHRCFKSNAITLWHSYLRVSNIHRTHGPNELNKLPIATEKSKAMDQRDNAGYL